MHSAGVANVADSVHCPGLESGWSPFDDDTRTSTDAIKSKFFWLGIRYDPSLQCHWRKTSSRQRRPVYYSYS